MPACAQRLGRDPVFVALAVGLNPLVLVHVVGGAHNDALVVLLLLGAVLAALERSRERLSGFLTTIAAGLKVSAGLVLPFLVLGTRRRADVIWGAVAAALAIVVVSVIAFGGDALDALGLIGENQERTSRWSPPQRSADAISGITSISGGSAIDLTVRVRRCLRRPPCPAPLSDLEGTGELLLLAHGDGLGDARASDRLGLARPLVCDLARATRRSLDQPATSSRHARSYMLVIAVPL